MAEQQGTEAKHFVFALQDLKASGDVSPDLGNLRLTEAGAARVREMKAGTAEKVARTIGNDARPYIVGALVTAPITLLLGWLLAQIT